MTIKEYQKHTSRTNAPLESAYYHMTALHMLMGMMTAVFGGVLRDIVCNEIPRAFSDHRPYALCAFAGGWVLVGAQALGWPDEGALAVAAGTAALLRVVVLWQGVTLPAWAAGPPQR